MYNRITKVLSKQRDQKVEYQRFERNVRAKLSNSTRTDKRNRDQISATSDINNLENIISL